MKNRCGCREVFMRVDGGNSELVWVYRESRRSGYRQPDIFLASATRVNDEISPQKI